MYYFEFFITCLIENLISCAKKLLLLKGLVKKLLVLQKFYYFIRFDADLLKTKLFLYL